MGTMDKFKYFMGIDEVEEDDAFVEEAQPPVQKKIERAQPATKDDVYRERPSGFRSRNNQQSGGEMKLLVIEPKSFDECSSIVDNLKGRKPLVINLEKLETEIAKRIFDFVSGATYALDGSIQKVANNIFVFAPENVDITSNIDEFKSSSTLFR